MRAQYKRVLWVKMIGVIFHKSVSTRKAASHNFHCTNQGSGFPVTFACKTIAFSHQALGRDARKLCHSMQIFESIAEAFKTAILKESTQSDLNFCGFTQ